MRKAQKFLENHKRVVGIIGFIFIVCIQCCVFPFYNFTHDVQFIIVIINFIAAVGIAKCTGDLEAAIFPNGTWSAMLFLNLILALLGMAARYLLEYGEVSNTYNFTARNIVLHLVFMVLWSTMFWKTRVREKQESQNRI